jgi:hypothetical protein
MVPRSGGLLSGRPAPNALPSWLTEADLAFYAAEFKRTGFRGGLNWHRNFDRNWELLSPYAGVKVAVPALYVAGDRDLVMGFSRAPVSASGSRRRSTRRALRRFGAVGCAIRVRLGCDG